MKLQAMGCSHNLLKVYRVCETYKYFSISLQTLRKYIHLGSIAASVRQAVCYLVLKYCCLLAGELNSTCRECVFSAGGCLANLFRCCATNMVTRCYRAFQR